MLEDQQRELERVSEIIRENEETASFAELALLTDLNIKEDFAGDNLSGFDLSGIDLSYANLRRTNLSGTDLSGTNLSYANLSYANLENAILRDANLNYANLIGANLVSSDLANANVSGIEIDESTTILLSEITRIAIKKKRPILNFALGFSSIHGDEASIFHLSRILGSLQSLLNNIGQAIEIKKIGSIPEDIAEKTSVNASLFFQSSFGIQLVASNSEDLLGDSTITDAIEIFVKLVEASKSIDGMQKYLGELKHDSAGIYQSFIKHIRDSGASLKVEWSAANSINRIGSAKLSPSEVENVLEIVRQVVSENTQDIKIEGELIAGNAETKHFIMRDINSDKKYPGYILSEAIRNGEELILGKIYRALIRAVTKQYLISKQTTVEYKLVSYSRIFREDEDEKVVDGMQLDIYSSSQE